MNRRGRDYTGFWIMAAVGAVFVLWFGVLIAPYADGGLPRILAHIGSAIDHPFDLQICANTGTSILVCMFCLLYTSPSPRD